MLRSLIQRKSFADTLCCVFSALLLILAHPAANIWVLAWCAFVPLLFALDGKTYGQSFRIAYLCGFLFFTGSLFWFFNIARWFSFVGVLGIVLLMLYLSLYFGLFGLACRFFSSIKPVYKLIVLPCVWVVLEWVRARLFTGFDWVSLGHTQYLNTSLIQIAELTGVFGVSFIVLTGNVLIKESISAWIPGREAKSNREISLLIFVASLVIVPALVFGAVRLSSSKNQPYDSPSYSVAVVQANIPQEVKWEETAWRGIMEQYLELTRQAMSRQPDLVIWPETSYPGYLWRDKELFVRLEEFVAKIKTPLIVGSVLKEEKDYYNSAILLSGSGDVEKIYRKAHLVPFGEYLPLRPYIPWIADYLAIGDFTAGNKWTVFTPKPGPDGPAFSVLICFEDTVARLSRAFVQNGAQFLVNITNDAWFGDTQAPFMHLESAVFRTVENRRSLVRAANTGVSCFIDRWGRAYNCVEGAKNGRPGQTYISGYAVANVELNDQITFYTKYGDVFTIICFGCILGGIAARKKISVDH